MLCVSKGMRQGGHYYCLDKYNVSIFLHIRLKEGDPLHQANAHQLGFSANYRLVMCIKETQTPITATKKFTAKLCES
jgi:hypothetical protein